MQSKQVLCMPVSNGEASPGHDLPAGYRIKCESRTLKTGNHQAHCSSHCDTPVQSGTAEM
jgi:hypothetical protein